MSSVSTPQPGATDLDESVPKFEGRNAVYVAVTTRNFRPVDFREVPTEIVGCRLLVERVPMDLAGRFARVFNQQQLDRGMPHREWAIIVRRPRVARGQASPALQQRVSALAALADKGGAA